jgi:HK97 gp10 family phage protein
LAAEFSFSFDRSKFQDAKVMDKRLNRAIFGVAKYWDGRVEAHAKQKAPWNDRTTNARNGLKAEAVKLQGSGFAANSFAIILSHAVTYGIYLERGTRYMRARPIIMPTIEIYAPKVMRTLNKILDRL